METIKGDPTKEFTMLIIIIRIIILIIILMSSPPPCYRSSLSRGWTARGGERGEGGAVRRECRQAATRDGGQKTKTDERG